MGKKWGFTEREIGHMTWKKWFKLNKAYQGNYDLELKLMLSKTTYSKLLVNPQEQDDIIYFDE